MLLYFLEPRNRVLFIIYKYKTVAFSEFQNYNISLESSQIQDIIHTLILEQIIELIDNTMYQIKNINNNIFLRVLTILNQTNKSYTKTEIKILIKSKITNEIINQLIQSQFIYEYRTEFSKRNYLIVTEYKDQLIDQINQEIMTSLEKSNKTYDQAHCKMITNNQSILSYTNTEKDPIILLPHLTTNETKIIINLLNEKYQKHCHKIGKTEEEVCQKLLNNDINLTQKTLLSLIDKNIIRCSLKRFYYIDSSLLNKFRIIYEKNKKYLVPDF